MYCGDYLPGDTIDFKFTTIRPSTGAPFTLAGTPALSVYKNNSTTQTTTGVTLTVDFDSVTGLNHVRIVTSDAFYAAGDNYDVVITTGTVDSVSAVGYVVGRFTLAKVSALRPTTAGRTLDVSAGGEAGIDLANVGSPATTLNLSGTTISTSQQIASVSGAVGSVTGAVGSVTGAVGSVTGNVGGNVVGSVGSVVGTVTANTTQLAGQTVTAAAGVTFPTTVSSLTAAGVRTELSTELGRIDVATSTRSTLTAANVWQTDVSGYTTAGYAGTYLKGAGSSGDPWSTAIPGTYGAGTAGYILGTNLNATITSRLATSGYTAPLDAAGTRSALGLAAANLDTQLDALPTATENAAAVWNALVASYTTADTFGARLLRSRSAQAEVSVTGNYHVAADIHELQPAVIDNTHFAAGAIDSNALAASAATEIATATLTSAMTESYRAAGASPTLAQAAFELLAHMGDSSISGTTKTLKKIDGTTAKTFTLDSSTAPTSITEAT